MVCALLARGAGDAICRACIGITIALRVTHRAGTNPWPPYGSLTGTGALERRRRGSAGQRADAKALLDWAWLSPDEEFGLGLAAFFRTSARPENAVRVRYLFDNGLQAKAEWNLT